MGLMAYYLLGLISSHNLLQKERNLNISILQMKQLRRQEASYPVQRHTGQRLVTASPGGNEE